MSAKTAAERKREQRERDKLREEERQARLLAYRLQIEVYHATAEHLDRVLAVCDLEEKQDALTRLIHNAARLPDEKLREFLRQP
ncbi:hypothetical protein SAMN05216421_1072 [Halopseudomonas xinjiangensis]|uniref:Uncharacterized protein n=1 Tax=Halopseudomonas xinjiangensis TaxID=487184 RepID=A0A1H1Q6S6_9GAMM|nr:hypothetical protein [Halopseudomonas xinjiangensis]SDS19202.1 hypothetical protein SAMN05216421_1072 [Halopseudomonas xinjiangensis]